MSVSFSVQRYGFGVCALNQLGRDFMAQTLTKTTWRGLPVVGVSWQYLFSNYLVALTSLPTYPDWDAAVAGAIAATIPPPIVYFIRWATETMNVPLITFDIYAAGVAPPAPVSAVYDAALRRYMPWYTSNGTRPRVVIDAFNVPEEVFSGPVILLGNDPSKDDLRFAWDRVATYYGSTTQINPWKYSMFAVSDFDLASSQRGAPLYLVAQDNTDATAQSNFDRLTLMWRGVIRANDAAYEVVQRAALAISPFSGTPRPGLDRLIAPSLAVYSATSGDVFDPALQLQPPPL
jgi:hypothetical protein